MIVGNGLIAKEFKKNESLYSDYIIFASGVSNSSTTSSAECERELSLIQEYILMRDKKFIYFSSCSIFDESLKNTLYVKHKLEMEKFITRNCTNYNIYRLPIVVGFSQNPNTLTNFIYNSVVSNREINIYRYACRYLIDIEDVIKLVNNTLKQDNKIINLSLENKIMILDLVEIFEDILKKSVNKIFIEKGFCYDIDNSFINKFVSILELDKYNYNLINKYYNKE